MPVPSTPSIMPNVLGYAADTVQIPETTPTGQGIPSFRDLFPFITQVDPNAGGVMVERSWMNALFNLLGQHAFFQQSGCVYPWQATLDYIAGCHVMGSNGIEYVAQQSSGPDVPGVGAKNPTTDTGVYWKASVAGGGRIPGEVVPFYNVKLGGPANRNPIFWGQSEPDTGWLFCDGGSDGRGGTVPDLRSRFIACVKNVNEAGELGGEISATPTITVASSASHVSVQGTTLTENMLAIHNHSLNGYLGNNNNRQGAEGNTDVGSLMSNLTNSTGGSLPHTHGITDATHTHTATASAVSTVPPYYKLVYCVKIPEA